LAKKGIDIGIALAYQYKEMEEKLRPYGIKIHHFENHKGSFVSIAGALLQAMATEMVVISTDAGELGNRKKPPKGI